MSPARAPAALLLFCISSLAIGAEPRVDLYGDPLPEGAVARLGTVRFRAPGVISEVRVSPDGKRIAAHCSREFLVFDAKTGRVLRELQLGYGPHNPFAWLPDGHGVLLLSNNPRNPRLVDFTDPDLRLPDPPPVPPAKTERKIQATPAAAVSDVPGPFAFSPDGRLLAAETYDAPSHTRLVILWEVSPGKRLRELKPVRDLGVPPGGCADLRFTGDGAALGALCASGKPEEHRFVLWDLKTGKERCRHTVPMLLQKTGRRCFALSPDGKWLAVGLEDGTARLFDLSRDVGPRPFASHVGKGEWRTGVSALAFSPDGKLLVTAGRDTVVRGWDPETLREAWPGKNIGEWVESVDFFPGGTRLVTAGQAHAVRLWDAATSREIETPAGHRGVVFFAVVSPDGKTAITAGMDEALLVWELPTGRPRRRIEMGGHVGSRLALAPDGKTALVTVGNALRAWDVTTGGAVALPGELAKAAGVCHGFGPGGRALVLADTASASLWDWPSGRRLHAVDLTGAPGRPPYDYCIGAALSADGALLATSRLRASTGMEVGYAHTDVWDVATGKHVARLECSVLDHAVPCFLPSGREVALAAWPLLGLQPKGEEPPPTLGLWDARTGKLQQALAVIEPGAGGWPRRSVRDIALSPDGRTLAAVENAGLVLYEVATGQVRRHITGHRSEVLGAAFTPDGRRLVTARADHTALVWDVSLAGAAADRKPPADDRERGELWAALSAGPARPAYEAMPRLAADPAGTVGFLKGSLRPVAKLDRAALERLFADLESDRFATRQRAAAGLDRLGRPALGPARERLGKATSEEVRERLKRFVEKHEKVEPTPEELRQMRAVELLEAIGSPEAKALLRDLAGGEPTAALTRDAAESLRRLER